MATWKLALSLPPEPTCLNSPVAPDDLDIATSDIFPLQRAWSMKSSILLPVLLAAFLAGVPTSVFAQAAYPSDRASGESAVPDSLEPRPLSQPETHSVGDAGSSGVPVLGESAGSRQPGPYAQAQFAQQMHSQQAQPPQRAQLADYEQAPIDDQRPMCRPTGEFVRESLAGFFSRYPLVDAENPYTAEDTDCGDGSCGICRSCCRTHDLWGSAEFLLWWGKGSHAPPLVTTSPQGTPLPDAGRIGAPGTTVLAGDGLLGTKVQPGGRFTLGMWLDPEHDVALAGNFTILGGDSVNQTFGPSTGNPILIRPFFNALLAQQDGFIVAYPGVSQGSVNVSYDSRVYAAESYLKIMLERDRNRRVDLIAGYQFFQMNDHLSITSNNTSSTGFTFDVFDRFRSQNNFHGGQLGLRGEMMRDRWSLNGLAKLAYGNMHQQVDIAGGTTVSNPPAPGFPLNGGLLAQPTNIGSYSRDRGVFIPELNVNLVYHHNANLSFSFGYDILWISNVVTSGQQVDFSVNPSQLTGPLVGPARPSFHFDDQTYWLQGMNFAVNWDF